METQDAPEIKQYPIDLSSAIMQSQENRLKRKLEEIDKADLQPSSTSTSVAVFEKDAQGQNLLNEISHPTRVLEHVQVAPETTQKASQDDLMMEKMDKYKEKYLKRRLKELIKEGLQPSTSPAIVPREYVSQTLNVFFDQRAIVEAEIFVEKTRAAPENKENPSHDDSTSATITRANLLTQQLEELDEADLEPSSSAVMIERDAQRQLLLDEISQLTRDSEQIKTKMNVRIIQVAPENEKEPSQDDLMIKQLDEADLQPLRESSEEMDWTCSQRSLESVHETKTTSEDHSLQHLDKRLKTDASVLAELTREEQDDIYVYSPFDDHSYFKK